MNDLLAWITFGLVAGLTPGPLLTVVISETLQHGRGAGFKVAMAPLLVDAPMLALAFYSVSRLREMNLALGVLSIAGAAYIVYLAVETLGAKAPEVSDEPRAAESIKKGIGANLLNPNPYLFWFSIGAPLMVQMFRQDRVLAVVAMSLFYILLVGSKMVIAAIVASARGFLKSEGYRWTLRLLGLVLLVFAGQFLWQGFKYIGVI